MKINPGTTNQKPTLWIPSFKRLIAVSVLISLLLFCSATQGQQTIQWETNLERAQQLAKQQDKLVLLHFTASWSLPCRNLANFVHAESRVRSAFRDNLIAVKIDVDKNPELVERYEVPSVPFEVILTADKKIVSKRKSPDNSSAYYKMVNEWAVLLNDASKVNHAIAGLQNLSTSQKQKFQGQTTSFSPIAPIYPSPAHSPESARLKRSSENSPFSKPIQNGNANSKPSNANVPPSEAKPFRSPAFGTGLPANQVPEKSSAFSGPNYKKFATKNKQPHGFIQVPTGQVKKNQFFVPKAKPNNPLATNVTNKNTEPTSETNLPKFKIPIPQSENPNTKPQFTLEVNSKPLLTNKPPVENPKLPNNDFRPPNPPQLTTQTSSEFASPNPKLAKPKVDDQIQPRRTAVKSPTISPKQLLADSTDSVKKKLSQGQKAASPKPAYALRGKCPVSLLTQGKWVNGDPQWGCIHRNQVYIFSSELNLKRFKENPEAYSPILAGFDPVVFHETGKLTTGLLNHGVFMGEAPNQRIILFSDSQTRARFQNSPKQYLETVRQAMDQTDAVNRFRR